MARPNSWADLLGSRPHGRNGLGSLPPGLPHLTDNQFKEFMRSQRDIVDNALMARQEFFKQFLDPRRSIDDECGYPSAGDANTFGAEAYKSLYDRHPIAARVCEVMPQECWQANPFVYEDKDPDVVTPFEEDWDNLGQQLRGERSWYQDEEGSPVYNELRNGDILSGIGHFGIVLLGFDDGKNLQEPVAGALTMNDAYMTEKEEAVMNAFADGTEEVRIGTTPENPQGLYNFQRHTFALNGYEKAVINNWKDKRQLVLNKVATGASDLSGTDQQYTGVQFGPSETPASEPVDVGDKPRLKLLFLRSFDESLVQIVRYEWNMRNPRFGQPVMYRVTLNDPREQHSGVGLPLATVFVHWSRVLHLTDGYQQAGNSKTFSAPRMRCNLNRLLDISKLYGGGAEGYWRSCFAGLAISTHPQLGGDVEINTSESRDSMENYFNGLQRYLLLSGASANTLAPSVVDPSSQIEKQIEAICIKIPCPVRVFKGSERGELASTQDDDKWLDVLRARNNGYTTPRILVPFIDRLILVGVLREPGMGKQKQQEKVDNAFLRRRVAGGWLVLNAEEDDPEKDTEFLPDGGYSIEWPPLDALGAKDKAAICLQNTQAAAAYTQGVEAIIPPKEWLTSKKFMDMEEEEAQSILESASAAHDTDMAGTMTMPPAGGPGGAAKPPPPPPTPIIAPKAGVPPGTPGAPPAGIPKAEPPEPAANELTVNDAADYLSSVLNESVGEVASWITVGGQHIPLGKGEDKEAAIKSHFDKLKAKGKSEGKHGHKEDDHGHDEGHGDHGHGDHHGGGAALEHAAHEYHSAHDAHHIAEAFGGHQGAHEAVSAAHEEASHAAHAAHEAGDHASAHGAGVHENHALDAAAIVARHLYEPALKAAAHMVNKVPGGRAAAEKITAVHDAATKVATTAVKKLEERYGKATAAAILGAGSLSAGAVTKAAGLGSLGKALPGQKFIGAVPYVAIAEVGKRLGLVGPDTKIDKGLERVGTWVHAARAAIGKPFQAAGSAAASAGLKGAKLAGKGVRKLTGNEELDMWLADNADDKVTMTPKELRKAYEEFEEEVKKEMEKLSGGDEDEGEE